ncbi:MAG: hypothetical protein IPJ76_00125 [Flavobacteriales bacterium]|nr:MAG: hypothetical protein IPJ76_00125 [Flavobacteriales bacterium]
MEVLWRLLSYVWPVRLARYQGAFGPLDVVYEYGVKVLNTPNANQSHGSLHTIWQRVFRQVLSTEEPPASVLLLGLGGGSVVKILRDERAISAPITAVELDPVMVRIATDHFGLKGFPDVKVIIGDAFAPLLGPEWPFDLVVVDVFVDDSVPAAMAEPEVIDRLMSLTSRGGQLLINTMDRGPKEARMSRLLAATFQGRNTAFTVLEPMEGNKVFWWRPVERG